MRVVRSMLCSMQVLCKCSMQVFVKAHVVGVGVPGRAYGSVRLVFSGPIPASSRGGCWFAGLCCGVSGLNHGAIPNDHTKEMTNDNRRSQQYTCLSFNHVFGLAEVKRHDRGRWRCAYMNLYGLLGSL